MSLREYKKNINDVKSIEDYNKLIKKILKVAKNYFKFDIIKA